MNLHNTNALMAAYHQSKTQRPKRNPPPPPQSLGDGSKGQYRIPGLGEYGREQNKREFLRRHPEYTPHDDYPYPRNVFKPKRRGPTRPSPGSRPHRPRLD